jgi:hypothetical protein
VLQLGAKFLEERGFKHIKFLSADGALESYPPVSIWFPSFSCCVSFFCVSFSHVFIRNQDYAMVKLPISYSLWYLNLNLKRSCVHV